MLLDGLVRNGKVLIFSPYSPNLILEVELSPKDKQDARKQLIQVERVACIAFHKGVAPFAQSGSAEGNRTKSPLAEPRLLDPDVQKELHPFHKDKVLSSPSETGASGPCGRFKIHVPGGKNFPVEVAEPNLMSPLGFYATPTDSSSAYREIFFFAHGINAKERDEQLGTLLVREGMVPPEAIERGLAVQEAHRRVRIGEILIEQKKLRPETVEEAIQLQQRKRMRLGEVLVEAGAATEKDIETALSEQKQRKGKRLGEVLVEMKIISERDLASALARKFQMPFVDLGTVNPNPASYDEVTFELIKQYGFLPLDTDDRTYTVAISDPLVTQIHDVLRFHLQKRINEVLVTPSQLREYVEKHLANLLATRDDMGALLKALNENAEVVEDDAGEESFGGDSDSTTIKLANQVLIDAIKRGASDIHIEPNGKESNTIIRFRIDGDCIPYQEIPGHFRGPIVARIKIMAKLDISERRKPQDGKIRFKIGDKQIELRVATIPTVNGNEDVVLRILAASKPMPLEKMGMSLRNLSVLKDILSNPYGLILCVGPTGSGKTTTLHSALGAINTVDMKIWTAEDPVEITQRGLRQVQVQPKIGFTFAAAMRAFLRADPDVIMIGEMRDEETAATAVEASLTGHLVLSTLHTNSAPETITRLLDMGMDPFSFADALLGVLAQRLARSLCNSCKEPIPITKDEYDGIANSYGGRELLERNLGIEFGPDVAMWKARGCEACGNTGYKGRVALHELLANNDPIKQQIQRKAPVGEIRAAAMKSGMTSLLQDGIEKALSGKTDLTQVLAVCKRR